MVRAVVEPWVGWREQLRRHPELRDTSKWPLPGAIDGLKGAKLKQFYSRRTAVMRVVEGQSVNEEAAQLGVSVNELYRLLNRALGSQPDAEPLLTVALVPDRLRFARIGRFLELEQRFPEVFDLLKTAVAGAQKQASNAVRYTMVGYWGLFLRLLGEHGAKSTEYPFSQQSQARESLRKWIVRAQIEAALPKLPSEFHDLISDDLFDVFDIFQTDGHLQDFESGILIEVGGVQCPVKIPRFWLLCTCDEVSGYIVGRSWGVSKQYSQDDVLECLSDCARPLFLDESLLARLELPPVRLPNAETAAAIQHAVPMLKKLDNAWANSSNRVRRFVRTKWKSVLNYGFPKQPLARRVVEMVFQRIAAFEHLLPSTTGTGVNDPARTQNKSVPRFRAEDIESVIDWAIATINSTESAALKGLSPLEYVEHRVRQGALFRCMDTSHQPLPNPFIGREKLAICGNAVGPDTYHVNFKYGRYGGSELGLAKARGEDSILVENDSRDGRSMTVINNEGRGIATLELQGPWKLFKHDLRLRSMVVSGTASRRLKSLADIAGHIQKLIDTSNQPRAALQLFYWWNSTQERRLGARSALGDAPAAAANDQGPPAAPSSVASNAEPKIPNQVEAQKQTNVRQRAAVLEWKPKIAKRTA